MEAVTSVPPGWGTGGGLGKSELGVRQQASLPKARGLGPGSGPTQGTALGTEGWWQCPWLVGQRWQWPCASTAAVALSSCTFHDDGHSHNCTAQLGGHTLATECLNVAGEPEKLKV